MTYEIYKLAAFLSKKGFEKEYLLLKKAVPLIDSVSLPSYEGDEPQRDVFKIPYYPKEDWYNALSAMGSNAILIPFSANNIDEDILQRLFYIWSERGDNYMTLKDNVSFMGDLFSDRKSGDLDNLKEAFPDLWNKISQKLNEMNLDESEVTYILYNEDNSPPRSFFIPEKSPRYLAHDIGHLEIDFSESYGFESMLRDFLEEAAKFYIEENFMESISEDDSEQLSIPFPNQNNIEELKEQNSLYSELKGSDEYMPNEHTEEIIADFFEVYSSGTDHIADVFSIALSGNLRNEYSRPDMIFYKTKNYVFDNSKENEMNQLEQTMINNIMKYVENNDTGPLAHNKGSVLLYDL